MEVAENALGGAVVFDPQVIQPGPAEGKDTFLYYKSGYNRDDYNYGAYEWLRVGRTNFGSYDLTRTLQRFDLSNIPPDASITSAKLNLYCIATYSSQATVLNIHKILPTRDWTEGNQIGTAGYTNELSE